MKFHPNKPCETPLECFCLKNPDHKKCSVVSVSIDGTHFMILALLSITIYIYRKIIYKTILNYVKKSYNTNTN
jgi:hypothetical protein